MKAINKSLKTLTGWNYRGQKEKKIELCLHSSLLVLGIWLISKSITLNWYIALQPPPPQLWHTVGLSFLGEGLGSNGIHHHLQTSLNRTKTIKVESLCLVWSIRENVWVEMSPILLEIRALLFLRHPPSCCRGWPFWPLPATAHPHTNTRCWYLWEDIQEIFQWQHDRINKYFFPPQALQTLISCSELKTLIEVGLPWSRKISSHKTF